MKSTLILLSLTLTMFQQSSLFAQDADIKELGQFLDSWHLDAANVNMQAYFDKIDKEGVFIGTDATENWTWQEFYDWSAPYFEKGKAWTFKATERNIYFSKDGSIAWFDESLESSSGILRGSGVVAMTDQGWKIKHYVLSLPVPNEKYKEVNNLISP